MIGSFPVSAMVLVQLIIDYHQQFCHCRVGIVPEWNWWVYHKKRNTSHSKKNKKMLLIASQLLFLEFFHFVPFTAVQSGQQDATPIHPSTPVAFFPFHCHIGIPFLFLLGICFLLGIFSLIIGRTRTTATCCFASISIIGLQFLGSYWLWQSPFLLLSIDCIDNLLPGNCVWSEPTPK